jgi:hypothetical protein
MESANGNDPSWMDVILQFFQEDQWNYQKLDNKPVIRAGYRGEHGTWVCYAQVDEALHRFSFHSLMGLNIAPQYRVPVVEYLTRVNYLLAVGSFDMDLDTGNVRFRTSIELYSCALSVEQVRSLAYTTVRTMDHFFPGVMAVVHGGLLPEMALERIDPLPALLPREGLLIDK